MEFRAGQSIFRQGERGERFYIVQEGAVTVSKTSNGERTMLAKLGEGAYFRRARSHKGRCQARLMRSRCSSVSPDCSGHLACAI